jgi:diacylglycerol kinase family enzyme
MYAPVAQLDRALPCGGRGRRFESCQVYQAMRLTHVGLFVWIASLFIRLLYFTVIMATHPERVLLISNPSSSRASEVQQHVIDPIMTGPLDDREIVQFSITDKDRFVTIQQIAAIIQPYDRVIVVGGDGSGSVTINGIMNAPDSTGVRVGFLPYGNFNDMATTFTHRSAKKYPLQLLTANETVTVHPLDVCVDQQHHQYALLYATVGWTALTAAEFDEPKKRTNLQKNQANLVSSLIDIAHMYFRTRHSSFLAPFHRPGQAVQTKTTDILAINGPIMAKIIRSGQDLYQTEAFLSNDLNISKFFANSDLLGRSALNYLFGTHLSLPGVHHTTDTIIFESPSDIPLQIDGEVSLLTGIHSLKITKDQLPNAQTITVIKTS